MLHMKIKHIVFDWDGTLADTYPVIVGAYKHTFNTLKLAEISYDEIKRLTSVLQNKDTMEYIFGAQKDEAEKAYYNYINKHHVSELKAIPNAENLLKFCQNTGLKSYLITNKKRPYLLEEANKLGFTKFFDKIITAGDFAQDKPHPLATHAVFDNKLPDADSIMIIGDGAADWQVARTYDHNNKKALCTIYNPNGKYMGESPDYTVSNLNEIIDILTPHL